MICEEYLQSNTMKNILFLALLPLALAGCKKDIDELPEPTQTGANTFGARLNGEFWVPRGFGIAPTGPTLEARYSGDNSVFINASDFSSSPTETEFEIYLRNVTGPGTYLLNQNTGRFPAQTASYGYYERRRIRPLSTYITSATLGGRVEVARFDPINHIISGTFEFQVAEKDHPDDIIAVTEGRFDVKIQ